MKKSGKKGNCFDFFAILRVRILGRKTKIWKIKSLLEKMKIGIFCAFFSLISYKKKFYFLCPTGESEKK